MYCVVSVFAVAVPLWQPCAHLSIFEHCHVSNFAWMTLKILWLCPLIDADLQVSISPRRQEQQFWFVSWQPVNTCRSDGDKMLFGLDWSHDLQKDLFEKYFSNMLRCFLWPRSTTCWLYFFSYCVKTDDCSLCAAGSLHLCFWLKYLNIHWVVSY